jgi:hypothetical protein
LALAPATASASVTIGPVDPNPNPGLASSQALSDPTESVRFTASAPAGVQLTAPYDGVITSWQVFTDVVGPEATVRLRLLKPEGGNKYALAGAGPVTSVPEKTTASGAEAHNVRHVFATRVPIAAGRMVGVAFAHASGSYIKWVRPIQAGFTEGCFGLFCGASQPIPPDEQPADAFITSGESLAMNATFEPDTDRDGYGDETQDSCVGVCQTSQTTTTTTKSVPKKKKCKKGKKLKRGKCVKKKHHRRKKGSKH